MSIHTTAKPENTKIREIIEPRGKDMVSTKTPVEIKEIEISLPMLIVMILALAGVVYGLFFFFGPKTPGGTTTKKQPETIQESTASIADISLSDVAFKGNSQAKYAFIELSDPECPACQFYAIGNTTTASIEKQIQARYIDSGILRYGFVPYIGVPSHKPAATEEVVALRCAANQGKLFEYLHETFTETYGNGGGVKGKGGNKDSLLSIANTVGVPNINEFTSCLATHDIVKIDELKQRFDKEVREKWTADKGDYFGTPAFIVCKLSDTDSNKCSGIVYVGAFPFEDMKVVIDEYLGADAPKN